MKLLQLEYTLELTEEGRQKHHHGGYSSSHGQKHHHSGYSGSHGYDYHDRSEHHHGWVVDLSCTADLFLSASILFASSAHVYYHL